MTWFITDKPEVFRSEAGPFLAARPDLHTMLLSGLDTIEQLWSGGKTPPTVLGWWREPDEAATTAAFVWMPPHLLTASRLSQAAATHLAGSCSPKLSRLHSSWPTTHRSVPSPKRGGRPPAPRRRVDHTCASIVLAGL
ncbi:hypothetical protein ACFV3E_23255 [Streptomyces sp. NPDC059718]